MQESTDYNGRGFIKIVHAAGPETRAKNALACVRFIEHKVGARVEQYAYHSELAVTPGSSKANDLTVPCEIARVITAEKHAAAEWKG